MVATPKTITVDATTDRKAMAQVMAHTLRTAADRVYGDERAAGPHADPLSVASWLRAEADRIEHEAGEK